MRELADDCPFDASHRTRHRASVLGLLIVVCLLTLPADSTSASSGGSPGIGSLNDYVHDTQVEGYGSPPQNPDPTGGLGHNRPRAGTYRVPSSPALIGVLLLTLWAEQRYQEHHHHHVAANDQRTGRAHAHRY